MAEREGFEPSIPFQVYMISSHARSTTLPPLRGLVGDHYKGFRWQIQETIMVGYEL